MRVGVEPTWFVLIHYPLRTQTGLCFGVQLVIMLFLVYHLIARWLLIIMTCLIFFSVSPSTPPHFCKTVLEFHSPVTDSFYPGHTVIAMLMSSISQCSPHMLHSYSWTVCSSSCERTSSLSVLAQYGQNPAQRSKQFFLIILIILIPRMAHQMVLSRQSDPRCTFCSSGSNSANPRRYYPPHPHR